MRSVRVILVRPRNPSNIGACARAMANFGHRDLVVVDPYEPIWQETRSAPGAEAIIHSARLVRGWPEAVKDMDSVIGTSSFHQRSLETATVELPNIHRYLASFPASHQLAIVFGSERSGLSNDELAACQAVIRIPTTPDAPSMNLAQSLAVVLYELRRAGWESPSTPQPAPPQEMESLIETLSELGSALDYPPGYEPAARLARVRRAIQGATFTPSTVRLLLSLSRWMLKKQADRS